MDCEFGTVNYSELMESGIIKYEVRTRVKQEAHGP